MFKKLTNFSYVRNNKEALGFYLAYFFLIVLAATLLGSMVGIVMGNSSETFQTSFKIGNLFAIVMTLLITYLILKSKNLLGNFKYLVIGVIGALLAAFGGALFGLIPVAYLTTRKK